MIDGETLVFLENIFITPAVRTRNRCARGWGNKRFI